MLRHKKNEIQAHPLKSWQASWRWTWRRCARERRPWFRSLCPFRLCLCRCVSACLCLYRTAVCVCYPWCHPGCCQLGTRWQRRRRQQLRYLWQHRCQYRKTMFSGIATLQNKGTRRFFALLYWYEGSVTLLLLVCKYLLPFTSIVSDLRQQKSDIKVTAENSPQGMLYFLSFEQHLRNSFRKILILFTN